MKPCKHAPVRYGLITNNRANFYKENFIAEHAESVEIRYELRDLCGDILNKKND